jgi:hypothetical protein
LLLPICQANPNFDGETGREILLRQNRLAQFYQDFSAEVVILVNPAVVEILYLEFSVEAVILVNPTVIDIFYQQFSTETMISVNPTF